MGVDVGRHVAADGVVDLLSTVEAGDLGQDSRRWALLWHALYVPSVT
jgi:hypothetical protein